MPKKKKMTTKPMPANESYKASFNKAQKHYETEDYAAGRPCSVSRKNILFPQYRCKFYIGKCERISF